MNEHDEFVRRVREALDKSAEQLDGATVTRLRAARRAALSAPRRTLLTAPWRLGMAFAAMLLLTVALYSRWMTPEVSAPAAPTLAASVDEAQELVVMLEGLELYEDLEFYQWLSEHEDHAG